MSRKSGTRRARAGIQLGKLANRLAEDCEFSLDGGTDRAAEQM